MQRRAWYRNVETTCHIPPFILLQSTGAICINITHLETIGSSFCCEIFSFTEEFPSYHSFPQWHNKREQLGCTVLPGSQISVSWSNCMLLQGFPNYTHLWWSPVMNEPGLGKHISVSKPSLVQSWTEIQLKKICPSSTWKHSLVGHNTKHHHFKKTILRTTSLKIWKSLPFYNDGFKRQNTSLWWLSTGTITFSILNS